MSERDGQQRENRYLRARVRRETLATEDAAARTASYASTPEQLRKAVLADIAGEASTPIGRTLASLTDPATFDRAFFAANGKVGGEKSQAARTPEERAALARKGGLAKAAAARIARALAVKVEPRVAQREDEA